MREEKTGRRGGIRSSTPIPELEKNSGGSDWLKLGRAASPDKKLPFQVIPKGDLRTSK